MKYRKLSANYIYPVDNQPLNKGIITIDQKGEVISIDPFDSDNPEKAGVEFYNGIIIPGLIDPLKIQGTPPFKIIKDISKFTLSQLNDLLAGPEKSLIMIPAVKNHHIVEVMNNFHQKVWWGIQPQSNHDLIKKLRGLSKNPPENIILSSNTVDKDHTIPLIKEIKEYQTKGLASFEDLLKWSSIFASRLIELQETRGSITPGKKPGLFLIDHFDFKNRQLTVESTVRKFQEEM